jgi:hypothetical protein
MAAHADDLRNWYAEALGDSETIAAITGSAKKNVAPFPNGRYLIQFHTLAGGVAIVWCRQGPHGSVAAAKASPSTPMEVSVPPRPTLTVMVRDNLDGLSFITDAGTCSVTITKISRGKN